MKTFIQFIAEQDSPTHVLKHKVNSKGNIVDAGTLLRKVNNPSNKDTYTLKSGPNTGVGGKITHIKVPESSVEEYKKDK